MVDIAGTALAVIGISVKIGQSLCQFASRVGNTRNGLRELYERVQEIGADADLVAQVAETLSQRPNNAKIVNRLHEILRSLKRLLEEFQVELGELTSRGYPTTRLGDAILTLRVDTRLERLNAIQTSIDRQYSSLHINLNIANLSRRECSTSNNVQGVGTDPHAPRRNSRASDNPQPIPTDPYSTPPVSLYGQSGTSGRRDSTTSSISLDPAEALLQLARKQKVERVHKILQQYPHFIKNEDEYGRNLLDIALEGDKGGNAQAHLVALLWNRDLRVPNYSDKKSLRVLEECMEAYKI